MKPKSCSKLEILSGAAVVSGIQKVFILGPLFLLMYINNLSDDLASNA